MQAEEAVQIDDRLLRNVNAGAHRVVLGRAVRDDNIEAIGGTALEDHDQALGARCGLGGSERNPREKAWYCGRPDYGESTVADENAACDRHNVILRRDLACYVVSIVRNLLPGASKRRCKPRLYLR